MNRLGVILIPFAIAVSLSVAEIAHAAPCPSDIDSCGCTIDSPGKYSVVADLTSADPSGICIDVASRGVLLDLAGKSITGPGGTLNEPGVGLRLSRTASGALVSGGGASISGFTTGIEIDAHGATVEGFIADANGDGVDIFGSGASNVSGFEASNNQGNGVLVYKSNHNSISDFTANNNGSGVVIMGASHNAVLNFAAGGNLGGGIQIAGISGCNDCVGRVSCGLLFGRCPGCPMRVGHANEILNGEASNNGLAGIATLGHANRVIGNTALSNAIGQGPCFADLVNENAHCVGDVWRDNTFSTSVGRCIH